MMTMISNCACSDILGLVQLRTIDGRVEGSFLHLFYLYDCTDHIRMHNISFIPRKSLEMRLDEGVLYHAR